VAVAGLIALAGCGSSKPAYCSARTNLENSIKGLQNLNVSSGISGLESKLKEIQTTATAMINAAKSDFPSQTSALKSSLDALTSSVNSLTSNPSAANIATVASDAATVVSSAGALTDATSSKCS
jgi:hypothetical protein